jgi:catechol 2,3-dioxygenase-like lactoylglutathione lyase family enzyme
MLDGTTTFERRSHVLRIHEVIIEVGDVDAAISFYTEVIGLRHVRTVTQDDVRIAELEADGQRVTLLPSENPRVRLAFEAASARGRQRRLAKHEIAAHDPGPVDVPGGRWLGFADPWGNELGFWEVDATTAPPDAEAAEAAGMGENAGTDGQG